MFYGWESINTTVTILTGGFLHIGDILSTRLISIAQYIAPFMGNFHPNANDQSNVYYYSDSEFFKLWRVFTV